MRALRDLRDLVNVSRLSYVDSDNDEDNLTSNYTAQTHSLYSIHSQGCADLFEHSSTTFFNEIKQNYIFPGVVRPEIDYGALQ